MKKKETKGESSYPITVSTERLGKERKEKKRKEKERRGEERKGEERKGKEITAIALSFWKGKER